jgi:LPXTG-site transpeptidase (sortase) family protein
MFEGIELSVLDYGPGHWPDTAMPGEVGNVVVAGHRVSHNADFRDVDDVSPGDDVIFNTSTGRHVYSVVSTEIVQPDALWIVDQTDDATATLFACHPPGSVRANESSCTSASTPESAQRVDADMTAVRRVSPNGHAGLTQPSRSTSHRTGVRSRWLACGHMPIGRRRRRRVTAIRLGAVGGNGAPGRVPGVVVVVRRGGREEFGRVPTVGGAGLSAISSSNSDRNELCARRVSMPVPHSR